MRGGDLSLALLGGLMATAGDTPLTKDQETTVAWTLFAVMMVFALVLMTGIFALQIYSCVWACGDADRRGKSGVLIGLLVFFTWPLGLLIWLVARPEQYQPPPPPDPKAGLGPGEWIGYSLGFWLIPLANVVVSSILYYVWRSGRPRKARQINGLGWAVFLFQALLIAVAALTGQVQHQP